MAVRNSTALSFSSVTYNAANKDKRWHMELPASLVTPLSLDDSAMATIVSNLFNSTGASGLNSVGFYNSGATVETVHSGDLVIAARIPQTKRLLDFVFQRNTGSDELDTFTAKTVKYDIYVSGRSDKKYSEIIDWVKVADQTGQVSDLNTEVYLPYPVAGDTYVTNSANKFHAKAFPYYTSWVKIVFHDIKTTHAASVANPQVSIARIGLFDFQEDINGTEAAPTVEMVFPKSGSKWLPSQTVYFTARAYEPNSDACHFSFEIYKETTGNTTLDAGDTLMYTVDSNALNLDGTVNENYVHTWAGLPIRSANAVNKVYLPGYPTEAGSGVYPSSILVVPTAGNTVGSPVNIANVKFYDNVGNQLKFDAAANGVTFSPINVPVDATVSATGWLINFSGGVPVKFNRIDVLSTGSATTNPTKVEIYYCTGTVGSSYTTVASGVWNVNSAGTVFRGPSFEANIEFCWPKIGTVNSFDPSLGARPITGYAEGLDAELDANIDAFNPDRNGIGIGQTNAGDWAKVHKFAGVLLGASYSAMASSTNTGTKSGTYGDSPIPTEAANKGLATRLLAGSGAGINTGVSAGDTSVCDKILYVRIALPDPYQDGDRFYAKCKVWDGRTQTA